MRGGYYFCHWEGFTSTVALMRVVPTVLVFGVLAGPLFGQTNPTPFTLSSGTYTLTAWDAANPAGTYPPNMIFHRSNVQDPQLMDEMVADYTGAYNLSSGTRINGLGIDGFSFLNTSTNGNLGAAVLALNTTGRVNIQVTWTGGTVATGAREYRIRLQYRIGTTGTFTDVLIGGQPVEYVASSTAGHSQTFGPITLPAALENQPVVQLRWKYYYVPPATGTRPQLRVDDIIVTSTPAVGVPTRLSITEILPATPSANTPFSVTVRAEDNDGIPRNVTQSTTVTLSVAAGSGSLTGTVSGVIAAGTNTVTISSVRYSVAESAVRLRARATSGMNLSDGVSAPFTVLPRASSLAVTAAPRGGYTTIPLPPLTVEARRPDGTVDPNYPEVLTVTKVSGPGTLSGTLSKTPTNGVASFTDLTVDQPGTYVLRVSSPDLPPVQTAPFPVLPVPQMSELIVPQYMKSLSSTLRVPVWALVELTDLQPNTTYRYFAGGDTSTTTTGVGAGITLFYDAIRDTFYYNSFRSLTTPGQYSVFRTGPGQTSIRLWLNLIPSTNIRFAEGNRIYWLLFLGDSVGTLIRRFSGSLSMQTLDFGSEPTRATGLADRQSCLPPRRILCFYDNPQGIGRPIATAMVQDEGIQLPGGASFYAALDSVPGGWATLIPNTLPSGIRRIEERRFEDGRLVRYWTSSDGSWGNVSTVNPAGGAVSPLYVETPCIELLEPAAGAPWCMANLHAIRWNARGVRMLRIELSSDSGRTFMPLATGVPASAGSFGWQVPDTFAAGTVYRIRLVDEARPWFAETSAVFTLYAPPRIQEQPQSAFVCLGEPLELSLRATGTGLTYQWYRNGQPIPGATAPTLRIAEARYDHSGAYTCVVSGVGTCRPETSAAAYIYVVGPTQIVQQPTDQAVPLGATAFFRVEAEVLKGTYQWRRNGEPLQDGERIMGANSSLLTLRAVQPDDTLGVYDVIVRGRCGEVVSQPARLRLLRVFFVEQPQNQDVCAGGVLRLRGLAVATSPGLTLQYRWLRDGVPLRSGGRISGAESEELVISPVLPGDSGSYQLQATLGELGETALSQPALVDVLQPPVVQEIGDETEVCLRSEVTLYGSTAVVEGKKLRFQWLHNGRIVGTDSTLRLTVADTSAAGQYWVVIANDCGADTVLFATLRVPRVEILQQPPREVTVREGSTLELTVVARNGRRYQWFHNGMPIPGATQPTLTLRSVRRSDSGSYVCRVYGLCDSLDSETTLVHVEGVGVQEGAPEAVVLRLIPQPAGDRVWIQLRAAVAPVYLRLYSPLSELLWQREVGASQPAVELDLSSYSAGLYWLEVHSAVSSQRLPLLIVR